MTNLKKNGKKGFTLAELLIVVAIIAVLTAIAVPLFVGSLNNANKTVEDANIRAVRGTAVAVILGDTTGKFNKAGTDEAKSWAVYATVTSTGEVTLTNIVPSKSASTGTDSCVKDTATTNKGGYKVTVYVDIEDLTTILNTAPTA